MAEDGARSVATGFLPRVKDLPGDALAGAVNAVVSVPSGMATAALAGVNPVYGLYATTVAPTVGGLFASSQLMQIATTGASALAAGQAVASYPEEERGPRCSCWSRSAACSWWPSACSAPGHWCATSPIR